MLRRGPGASDSGAVLGYARRARVQRVLTLAAGSCLGGSARSASPVRHDSGPGQVQCLPAAAASLSVSQWAHAPVGLASTGHGAMCAGLSSLQPLRHGHHACETGRGPTCVCYADLLAMSLPRNRRATPGQNLFSRGRRRPASAVLPCRARDRARLREPEGGISRMQRESDNSLRAACCYKCWMSVREVEA